MIKKVLLLVVTLGICISGALINKEQIISNDSLFLKSIVIDPGHGGKDNGAYYDDVLEDEINLKISLILLDLCLENNMIATITRTDDYDLASLYAKNRKNEDLKRRVKYINITEPDIFISIHLNSYPKDTRVNGPMIYYRNNDEKSYLLGKKIIDKFNEELGYEKPLHKGDFYLLNNTFAPGVFVECGFISNSLERSKLLTEDYQYIIASLIVKGISDFLTIT